MILKYFSITPYLWKKKKKKKKKKEESVSVHCCYDHLWYYFEVIFTTCGQSSRCNLSRKKMKEQYSRFDKYWDSKQRSFRQLGFSSWDKIFDQCKSLNEYKHLIALSSTTTTRKLSKLSYCFYQSRRVPVGPYCTPIVNYQTCTAQRVPAETERSKRVRVRVLISFW